MITNIGQVKTADIIVVSDKIEPFALRGILENFGIQVRIHYIGNVKHLISLLQSSNHLHKLVIISCHGDKEKLLIPELASELETTMPYHKGLTSSDLQKILNLDKQIVINMGCCLGSQSFADSFLSKGAGAYIGAMNYIESNAFLLFTTLFLYFYLTKNLAIKAAFERAKSFDPETEGFGLWQNVL